MVCLCPHVCVCVCVYVCVCVCVCAWCIGRRGEGCHLGVLVSACVQVGGAGFILWSPGWLSAHCLHVDSFGKIVIVPCGLETGDVSRNGTGSLLALGGLIPFRCR